MDPTMVSKYSFANATIGFATQDNPTVDTHIWTLGLSTSHPGSSRTTPMTTHQVPKSMFKSLRSTFDGVPLNNSAICFILRKLTICMNSQQNIEWGHEVKWPLKLQVWPQLEVKNWDGSGMEVLMYLQHLTYGSIPTQKIKISGLGNLTLDFFSPSDISNWEGLISSRMELRMNQMAKIWTGTPLGCI